MSHRVLEVIIQQEIQRKSGLAIQTEEEQLRTQLEALNNQLRAPTQFRGLLRVFPLPYRTHETINDPRISSLINKTKNI